MNLFDLTGKTILITGSSRGIGYVLAKGLASHGAHIIINDRSLEAAAAASNNLREMGYSADPVVFDVTKSSQLQAGINSIVEQFGKIDVLINNAGIQCRHPLLDFPESDWDRVIDVNQKGVFLVTQAVARHMVDLGEGGKIINIASMQSELGRDTITPYAASKGAVKMLTRGSCVELARHNIQVNAIAPGYFKSEMTKALVDDEVFTAWLRDRTPADRWGELEELIGTAVYLSSNASNFVNGQLIFVDGGMLAAV
ncbi:gluconate 5-dehydrogenase [Vibrio sp. E150_011]